MCYHLHKDYRPQIYGGCVPAVVFVMVAAVQEHVWSLLIVKGVLQNFGYNRISDEREIYT
jgi:hypothetical protein